MQIKKRMRNTGTPPCISSSDILQKLIKEIFGTFFIEEDKWRFPGGVRIGRTFFSDRQKKSKAINHVTTDYVHILFQAALSGNSTYVPDNISRRLAHFYQEICMENFDYLIFFGDETDEVFQKKINMHLMLLSEIMITCEESEFVSCESLHDATVFMQPKMMARLTSLCQGTYTETVIRNIVENKKVVR